MSSEQNVERREVEIDLKRMTSTLFRFRYSILFVTLFVTFSAYLYAYLKINIYEAKTTVEVGRGSIVAGGGKEDVLSSLSDSMSLDTEFDIIRSRMVTDIALRKVDWQHHYFIKTKLKEWELYQSSPIIVEMRKGYGRNFFLYPSNDPKSFRLQTADFDKTYRYGEKIKTDSFDLTIRRVDEKALEDGRYRFYILNNISATMAALRGVSVDHGEGYSSVFTIKNQDTVPLRAQEFLNALAHAYMKQNIEKKTREASKMLTFIDEQLKAINKNLSHSAERLQNFKKNTNTAEISTKTQLIITTMNEYENKLIDISIEEKMLESLLSEAEKGKKLETLSIAGLKIEDTALLQLIHELQQAVIKRNAMLLDYTKANRKVEKINNTIKQISEVIVETLRNLQESIKARKGLIKLVLDGYEKRLKGLPENEKIYNRLEQNYQINQEIYSYLLKKRSETSIVKASTVSRNRIIDRALLPKGPFKPNRSRIIMLGMILGLLLGIAYAFIREFLDDTIKNEEDVRRLSSIPILGQIPHISGENKDIVVFENPKSAVSETFRTLRSNLRYMATVRKSEVIALTSTIGSEGKTTIAANLGVVMSMSGKRTVLLNMDLRRPKLARLFDLPGTGGMSSLLSGRATVEEVVQPTKYENLFLVSSGPIPPNPTELIEEGSFENIISRLREEYDVIILDTPPVGVVSDAMSLMHQADTTIYILRANYSKRTFLKTLQRLKDDNDIPGLGILINDVGFGLAYGYGYGSYGYGYYQQKKS